MRLTALPVGYLPLIDCAPLVVAREIGFAAEEGLDLLLHPAASWSIVRDMLIFGRVDAAHMLSPVPVAGALGLGARDAALDAVSVLSINGNVIGVSAALADRMAAAGHGFGFDDASAAGCALIAVAPSPLRIGVPFPFSMHAELVRYWLSGLDLPHRPDMVICTIPPAMMGEAVRAGEIDAFCVGEPWGSKAVDAGFGKLLLPGTAIWSFSPEKILAMRADWPVAHPDLSARLIRAVWRAGRWLSDPSSHTLAAEILARREYLDVAPEVIERALSGRILISSDGDMRQVERFVLFHESAAQLPWRSQGEWIARRLAARTGLCEFDAARRGSAVFRTDLFRAALATTSANLPSASSRVEGAPKHDTAATHIRGGAILYRNVFFDGGVFEPAFS